MCDSATREGTISFIVPNIARPCKTWYKIIGNISSSTTPLLLIHGGPGLSHDYLISLSELNEKYEIPIIFYDQIGNGRSTHLPEKAGDEEFWVDSLFWAELNNLTEKLGLQERGYDILGHSWGGMMGSTFAGTHPKGLRKLILSNAPADLSKWIKAYNEYRKELPIDVQEKIQKGIDAQAWDSEEFEEAMLVFLKKFTCGPELKEEFIKSFEWVKKDPTVTMTMLGPNEFEILGNMRNWSAAEAAQQIEVPTLVINGTKEGASDEAIKPYLDGIKNVKWVKLINSSHCPMYEEKGNYFDVITKWLSDK